MVRLHPPLDPPVNSTSIGRASVVQFRHPAYSVTYGPLLQLSAADSDQEGRPGIDYDTAFIACGIVTGNKWHDGWLAIRDSDGSFKEVERPDDDVLTGDVYYYCLDRQNPAHRYPVLPSFDHWRFPHGDIPEPWSRLVIPSGGIVYPDDTCRISGYANATEVAHLVPASAVSWFKSNWMQRYCSNPLDAFAINDVRNVILLRRDLHYLFDQRRFALAVKRSEDRTAQLVTHSFMPLGQLSSVELAHLYHNRRLQLLKAVSCELLFARFAWSIFTDEIYPFWSSDGVFTVQVYDTEAGQYSTKDLRAAQIKEIASLFGPGSRSRSVSPRKRRFNQDPTEYDGYSEGEQEECDAEEEEEEEWHGFARGRRRKRSWDHDSVPGLANSFTTSAATSRFPLESSPDRAVHLANLAGSAVDDESSRKRPRLESYTHEHLDDPVDQL